MKNIWIILVIVAIAGPMAGAESNPDRSRENAVENTEADTVTEKSEVMIPGFHQHDDFYLRFFNNLGTGYGYVKESNPLNSVDISYLSNSGSIQVGYAIVPNWIPFVSFDYNMTPAHMSIFTFLFIGNIGDANLNLPQPETDHTLVLSYSVGLTHYFMPQNYYVSFSVGLAQAAVLNDADPANIVTSETDFGVSFKLAVGKEWWVSANWGLGVAVYTEYNYFGETKSGPVVTPLNAFTIGIAASATFN